MTSETPKESRNASGEAASSDFREESRNGERGGAQRRPASSEELRSDGVSASGASRGSSELRSDGGVPLNIAGHEEEKRKREAEESGILDEVAADAPDADDEAEPVELLVQLAEDGEIEPWDIDIVTVTDKFLDRLDAADLRTSGRALFYASVLLRMKSDAMLADDDEEVEEEAWDEWEPGMEPPTEGDFPAHDPIDQLEAEMERRLDRKTARGSPETLDELVRELRERERGSWWKESRSYDTSGSPQGFQRGTQTLDYRADDAMRIEDEPSADDVTGTAHAEDIEVVIDDVRAELDTHYDAGRTEVLYAEIETVGGSRIETFLALLFLSHRETVVLEQDDLFGDLWVRNPDSVDDATDADADDPETETLAD
ncbi:segregation and condensation protein A [Halorussus amylolyticus]|uniref:segregation and condensation protein A n=1 Tax=Halorussus amylolyticus TaxID=1126242 RepID=UPI00138F274F|nr:ScpA family protein [Halorussus amylolyticus]